MRTHALIAIASLSMTLGGCSVTSALFPGHTMSAAALDGEWESGDGTRVTLDKTVGGGITVIPSREGAERYTGVLIDVDGTTIIELPLSNALREGATPVYHYGKLVMNGDTLTHQALKGEWLLRQSDGPGGITSVGVADDSVSRVAVGDPDQMRRMLERAVQDPAAWGPAETWTRVSE